MWPSLLAPWRRTRRPDLQLPTFGTACHYLRDPVLAPRLVEITQCANSHLAAGVPPIHLFGSSTDSFKFHEVTSCFYLASQCAGVDGTVFEHGVQLIAGGELHNPTIAMAEAFVAAHQQQGTPGPRNAVTVTSSTAGAIAPQLPSASPL